MAILRETNKNGIKHDQGKLRFSLFPLEALKEINKVLEYGARLYEEENWKKLENPKQRLYDACIRHLQAWWMGETRDKESGLSHLAHAGCCILFLLWFDRKR